MDALEKCEFHTHTHTHIGAVNPPPRLFLFFIFLASLLKISLGRRALLQDGRQRAAAPGQPQLGVDMWDTGGGGV